jgi:hypothetical protein
MDIETFCVDAVRQIGLHNVEQKAEPFDQNFGYGGPCSKFQAVDQRQKHEDAGEEQPEEPNGRGTLLP